MKSADKIELEKYRQQAREHSRRNAERVRAQSDRISVVVPKGRGAVIKKLAAGRGLSVNAYIMALIDEDERRRGVGESGADDTGPGSYEGGPGLDDSIELPFA